LVIGDWGGALLGVGWTRARPGGGGETRALFLVFLLRTLRAGWGGGAICCAIAKGGRSYLLLFLFLFYLKLFNRVFVFGRFVTRGVQKHHFFFFSEKSISAHHKKCGFFSSDFFFSLGCFLDFFNRVFGRFITRGVQKRDKKIAGMFPQLPKKVLTYLRNFFFHAPPWL
jgi:hypothetical protein